MNIKKIKLDMITTLYTFKNVSSLESKGFTAGPGQMLKQ